VNIVVESNEQGFDEAARLVPYKFTNVVQQVEFLYAPTSSEMGHMRSLSNVHEGYWDRDEYSFVRSRGHL
jgi:hypothetical protein